MTIEEFFEIVDELPCNERGCKIWSGRKRGNYPGFRTKDGQVYGHRLVLERRLGRSIKPSLLSLHDCDDKMCLQEEHLYEGTHKENSLDAISRGRIATGDRSGARTQPHRRPRGERHGMSKLTKYDVLRMSAMYASGSSRQEIAEAFNLSYTHVCATLRGDKWAHIPRPHLGA